jgi:hypothetical protein
MTTTFYAVIFLAPPRSGIPTDASIRKLITSVPNPDPGSIAEDILNEHPHALSIILIDENFRVVNEYRAPSIA